MKKISIIQERFKVRIAFVIPVSEKEFTTNGTIDEPGLCVFVNKDDDKYIAVSDGNGGHIKLRNVDLPTSSIISEVGIILNVDGVFRSTSEYPGFTWVATSNPANNKKYDFVVQGTSLYLRTVADDGAVQNIMKVDRENGYPSMITFGARVKGQDGVDPTDFVTKAQLDAKKAAANADVASANATDLATAITLVNELKAQVNSLQAKLRTATLLT